MQGCCMAPVKGILSRLILALHWYELSSTHAETLLILEAPMRMLQGKTGNPFFDCVGMDSGAVPFKSFVQANGNNAQTLANHFVSYLKGDLSTKVGRHHCKR